MCCRIVNTVRFNIEKWFYNFDSDKADNKNCGGISPESRFLAMVYWRHPAISARRQIGRWSIESCLRILHRSCSSSVSTRSSFWASTTPSDPPSPFSMSASFPSSAARPSGSQDVAWPSPICFPDPNRYLEDDQMDSAAGFAAIG